MTALELAAVDWTPVERAQAGDMDAFADIYRTHHTAVARFIYFRTGSQSLTDDLAQDVWVRALARIGTVGYQGRDISAWLMTIARNLIADHFKSSRVRTASTRNLDDLITERLEPVADDDPEAEVFHTLDAETARRLLAPLLPELTPDQQRVIRLRFFDELSTYETAAAMGQEVGAAKALQYRACQSLRKGLRGVRP